MYPKILPEVRGGAQRAEGAVVEGSVVEGKLLYYCQCINLEKNDFCQCAICINFL